MFHRAHRLALLPFPRSAPLALLALFALLAPGGCVTDKVTGEKRFALLQWSTQEEQQIGDEAAPNFEQQFGGAYPVPADQAYLGGVVKEMASHSVRKDDFQYKFEILNSSEPNAFALPGGYVYITRGLLQHLGSEAEFVAILGHELGHVEHQHSMLQQNKAIAATVLVGLVGVGEELLQKDPDQPNHVTALVGSAAPVMLLSFSRAQESEADVRGVHFAHAMGYDPREMKKTFEYFERLERASGGSTPSFLRSHPMNSQRISDIDATIAKHYPDVLAKSPAQFRSPPKPKDKFVELVASLEKKAPAYEQADQALALLAAGKDLPKAQKLAEQARAAVPDEPLFVCLAGEIQHAQGRGDKGRALFEQSRALQQKKSPGKEHWKPAFYLGVLDVEAGKGDAAVASLRRAEKLYPDHPLAAYYRGRAEEMKGDRRAAATAYARVAKLAPAESELAQKSAERYQALQPSPR